MKLHNRVLRSAECRSQDCIVTLFLNLQRFKVLYICGNYSSVLSRLDRRFQDLEVRTRLYGLSVQDILEKKAADP